MTDLFGKYCYVNTPWIKEIQAFRNVTVRILKCVYCGHVDIEWVRQENTEDITE